MLEKLLLGSTVKLELSNISVSIVLLFIINYGVQRTWKYALVPARHTRFTLSVISGNRQKSFTKAIIITKIVLLRYRDLYNITFSQVRYWDTNKKPSFNFVNYPVANDGFIFKRTRNIIWATGYLLSRNVFFFKSIFTFIKINVSKDW